MNKFRTIAALLFMSLALLAVMAQKPQQPPPDYFPLRVGDWWKYRSTTADGKQSEFTIKVLSDEKQGDGTILYLVETLSTFQPIHEWYSKPNGWVLMHRISEQRSIEGRLPARQTVFEESAQRRRLVGVEGKGDDGG